MLVIDSNEDHRKCNILKSENTSICHWHKKIFESCYQFAAYACILAMIGILWLFSQCSLSLSTGLMQSFTALDEDEDGELSEEEFQSELHSSKIFDILDINKDGGITYAELEKSLQHYSHKKPSSSPPPLPSDTAGSSTDDHKTY